MLEGMGEDPNREGLQKTPERVADFYAELTGGMWENASEHIVPLPGDSHDEMVIVKDISIASVCEHHLAPFVGKCHIAYIPKGGRIVGLSKLARIAEIFARRLQVQERLTQQIATFTSNLPNLVSTSLNSRDRQFLSIKLILTPNVGVSL